MAKPRMSRSASAAPRSPATVEKRTKRSVFLPIFEKILARVYFVMSWVTVKVPKAPEPLACMRRSGMTSRSKWASFSRYQTSWSSTGPRGPAVMVFWLSTTGAPFLVVSFLSLLMYSSLLLWCDDGWAGCRLHSCCLDVERAECRGSPSGHRVMTVLRVNFACLSRITGMQKAGAFRAGKGVQASRTQVLLKLLLSVPS